LPSRAGTVELEPGRPPTAPAPAPGVVELVSGRPAPEPGMVVMGRPEAAGEAVVMLPKLYWGMAEAMPEKAKMAAAEMVVKEGILIFWWWWWWIS
jgi:hypothetical protein